MRPTLLLAMLVLSACSDKVLVDRVSAKEAIEIVVALQQQGIAAERESSSTNRGDSSAVTVAASDYGQAVRVLHDYGLPREKTDTTAMLLQSQGIVPPAPELVSLKMDRIYANEIERLIRDLPGVLSVSATVRSTPARALSASASRPQATIVVRTDSASSDTPTAESLKQLAARVLVGATAEDVQIMQAPLTSANPTSAGVAAASISIRSFFSSQLPLASRIKAYAAVCVVLLLGFMIGFLFGWSSRRPPRGVSAARRETTLIKNRFLVESAIRQPESRGGGRLSS